MAEVKRKVDDGTEVRDCTIQLRETGIAEILIGMGDGGFCRVGEGRLVRHEGELLFQFCFNVGRYDTGIKALGVQVIVPLSEDEQKVEPTYPEEERDETDPADPVDPERL